MMNGKFLLLLTVSAAVAMMASPARSAESGRMRIPQADCRNLVEYRQQPGVAYTPGVDVRGKPVAPADLPGGLRLEPADDVEFDISFNPLRGRTGGRFDGTELYVGQVQVNPKTGEVTFNGVPLTDAEQGEIARHCRRALGGQ